MICWEYEFVSKVYPTNPKFIPHEFSMNDSTAFYEKQGFMIRLAGNSRYLRWVKQSA